MELYNFVSVASEIDSERSIIEVQLTMRSVPDAIAPVVDQLMLVIKACRCIHREDRTVETALREAFAIAVVRRGFETSGDIQVKCRCESEKEVCVTIRLAQGRKAKLRQRSVCLGVANDNDSAIRLIERCVDEVRFEIDGTALHLRKRFETDRKPSPFA